MIDDQGNQVKQAPPSTLVNILGWSGVPETGAIFTRTKNEREARREAEEFELGKKYPLYQKMKREMKIRVSMLCLQQFLGVKSTAYRVILKLMLLVH